jgi:hypothetical protein
MTNPFPNPAAIRELQNDLWIEQNVPGGLNSKFDYILFLFI